MEYVCWKCQKLKPFVLPSPEVIICYTYGGKMIMCCPKCFNGD